MTQSTRMPTAYHAAPPRALAATATVLRVLIGLVLLATALGKSLDLGGFAAVVGTYDVFPAWAWWPVAIGITAGEWVLGAWMLSGRRARLACGLAALMHASYAGWAVLALLRGITVLNCGCFGVFLARPLTWQTVIEDSVVTALCLIAVWGSRAAQGRADGSRGTT